MSDHETGTIVFSGVAVLISAITWIQQDRDRRAPLKVVLKPGDWTVLKQANLKTWLLIFNPSNRPNCIQSYAIWMKQENQQYKKLDAENYYVPDGKGEPFYEVNLLPLPIPSSSGIAAAVGTRTLVAQDLPKEICLEFELLDIYDRTYIVSHTIRNDYYKNE